MQLYFYNICGTVSILAKGRIFGVSVYYFVKTKKTKAEAIEKLFNLIQEDIEYEKKKDEIPGYYNAELKEQTQ